MPFLFSKSKSWSSSIKEYWSLGFGLLSLISVLIKYPKTNINEFPLTINFQTYLRFLVTGLRICYLCILFYFPYYF